MELEDKVIGLISWFQGVRVRLEQLSRGLCQGKYAIPQPTDNNPLSLEPNALQVSRFLLWVAKQTVSSTYCSG